MIHSESTLRDLATQVPGATTVFQRHHLDFCCGGAQTLSEACAKAGIDSSTVVAELETEAAPDAGHADEAQWRLFDLGDLVRHVLDTYHAFTHEKLESLPGLMTKVIAAHGARHPELEDVAAALEELKDDLEPHMMKEERILFPYAVAVDRARRAGAAAPIPPFGSASNPIAMMRIEHDRTGEILHRIRDAAGGFALPEDACPTWRALYAGLEDLERDLMLHIHFESNILFPKLLDEERPAA